MPPRSQISRVKPPRSKLASAAGGLGGGGGGSAVANSSLSTSLIDTLPNPAQHPSASAAQPISNGSGIHRNLRKGLLSASEVILEELVNESEDPFDLVSIIRFPPPVAAILRARLSEAFRQSLEGWREGVLPNVSARGHLGLTVTPTAKEDYRLFEVHVDLMEEAEINLMKRWKPDFDQNHHPPLIPKQPPKSSSGLSGGKQSGQASKAGGKAKSKARGGGSAASSVINNDSNTQPTEIALKLEQPSVGGADLSGSSSPPSPTPLATLQMWGLLTELPTLIEAYKSLDMETMIKSANISQMLLVYFPEDENRTLPACVTQVNGELHHCCEKVQAQLEGMEEPDQILLNDLSKLRAPKCPWLYPSGITAPTAMHRERRTRDLDLYTKAEIQTAELELLSVLRQGRHETAYVEVASSLEGFMQQEALQKSSTIHPTQPITHLSPDAKLTYVVPENPTDLFDNPASDLSDEMFEDEPTKDERSVFDGDSAAVARRRRERRQGPTVIATKGPMTGVGAMHTSLEEEFNELAQNQARAAGADLEADFEAEFSYGTGMVVENTNIGMDDDVSDHITSMKKIDPELIKKAKRKKKKGGDESLVGAPAGAGGADSTAG